MAACLLLCRPVINWWQRQEKEEGTGKGKVHKRTTKKDRERLRESSLRYKTTTRLRGRASKQIHTHSPHNTIQTHNLYLFGLDGKIHSNEQRSSTISKSDHDVI